MNELFRLLLAAFLSPAFALHAAEVPTADDIARCVETTKVVFNHKDYRDPKLLQRYYAPQFRALIKKVVAA